jgi:hypothetical protein
MFRCSTADLERLERLGFHRNEWELVLNAGFNRDFKSTPDFVQGIEEDSGQEFNYTPDYVEGPTLPSLEKAVVAYKRLRDRIAWGESDLWIR